MLWWYENNGERTGPVSQEELVELIAKGIVTESVLVWKIGMLEWRPSNQIDDLKRQEPPPLPSRAPRLPSVSAQKIGPTKVKQPLSLPAPDNPPLVTRSIETVQHVATWRRYFARLIDIEILFIVSVLPILLYALAHTSNEKAQVAAGMLLLTFVLFHPMLEAIVAEAFGNTPGKAILGISVHSLRGGVQPSLGDRVKRAYRVYVFGYGFPLLAVPYQHWRLKKEGSTGYDKGRYLVSTRKISGWRYASSALLILLLSFPFALTKSLLDQFPWNARAWMNPETRLSLVLPEGWSVSTESTKAGRPYYKFNDKVGASKVFLIRIDSKIGDSVQQKIDRGVAASIGGVTNSVEQMISGHRVVGFVGNSKADGNPRRLFFTVQNESIWRVDVIHRTDETNTGQAVDLALALFKTIPNASAKNSHN